jgi:FixJ family two-component response regulator
MTDTLLRLTDRQHQALVLAVAGHTHAQIAMIMGIRHRQAVTRLLRRARASQKARHEALTRILQNR